MKWISVDDRLPRDCGNYLVCINQKMRRRMRVAQFTKNDNQKKPHFYGNQTFSAKEITHWTPLPEMPNELP